MNVIHHRETCETAYRGFLRRRGAEGWGVARGFLASTDREAFESGFESGRRVGQQEERERLEQTLPMEEAS